MSLQPYVQNQHLTSLQPNIPSEGIKYSDYMPKAMRQKPALVKRRKMTDNMKVKNRRNALEMIIAYPNASVRTISNASDTPSTCVQRLRTAVKKNYKETITQLTNERHRGTQSVLTTDEEKVVVTEIKIAASFGFPIDKNIRTIMNKIADDGRKRRWKYNVRSDAAIRFYRARNRDITYRKAEHKTFAKLKAERYEHIKIFFDTMMNVEKLHPGITKNGDCVWNLDETAIDFSQGHIKKAFTCSSSRHGAFTGCSSRIGANKHITAVVAVSVAGRMTSTIFVVTGKHVMSKSFDVIPCSSSTRRTPHILKYIEDRS